LNNDNQQKIISMYLLEELKYMHKNEPGQVDWKWSTDEKLIWNQWQRESVGYKSKIMIHRL
jgi:hypothetical protein